MVHAEFDCSEERESRMERCKEEVKEVLLGHTLRVGIYSPIQSKGRMVGFGLPRDAHMQERESTP